MAYLGNQVRSIPFTLDVFSGDGSAVTFPLTRIPASTSSVAVYVNGLYQAPTTTYTLSVSNLVFTTAPALGTNNIQVLHLGEGQALTQVPDDGSVTTAKIVNGAVTTEKIADNAITSDKIAPGVVIETDVADGAITTSKLADANVTNAKIVSVANTKITGLITDGQIASISNTKITGLITNGQLANVSNTKITGLITNDQLADIANTKITGLITNNQLADIANTKITGLITNDQLADIANTKITGLITSAQIASVANTQITGSTGSWILISSADFYAYPWQDVADFTLPGGFFAYQFIFGNLIPSVHGATLRMRGGLNGIITTSSYIIGGLGAYPYFDLADDVGSSTNQDGLSGFFNVYNPTQNGLFDTHLYSNVVFENTSGGTSASDRRCILAVRQTMNTVRFYYSSGLFESGTIALYGMKSS